MSNFGGADYGEQLWGTPVNPGPPQNNAIPGAPGTIPGQFNQSPANQNTGATNNDVPPGSTSSVAGFIPDILMICQEACEQAGVDFTGPYALRSAKRSIDFLNMEWANEGINLWTIDQQTTAITAGQYQYAMPADTMDLLVPLLRTIDQEGNQNEILLAREDFKDYAYIPNKLYTGRPTTIFVQRLDVPVFYLWPVPDTATTYTVAWWRMRRMQNTGYSTNLVDMPFRFVPALISGLAWQMALKKPGPKDWLTITSLETIYRNKFRQAKREDRDRSPVYIAPDCGY